jgi:uncharacterized protein (TIGR02217 family)
MSNQIFPSVPGLTWPLKETPTGSTRVSTHVSGREVRAPLFAVPRYQFELVYDNLSSSPLDSGSGASSLQAIEGFFLAMQAQFESFLVKKSDHTKDISDSVVSGQLLGTGDGARTDFLFTRPIGSHNEPVGQVEPTGLNVYVDGVLKTVTTDYSVILPNVLRLATAPASFKSVTADYTHYFRCRFAEDTIDFSYFMYQLAEAQSVKLITVKE